MADYINNVGAADQYTDALTLGPVFTARSAIITVANNPALMQFAVGRLGDWAWTEEREFFSIPQAFRVGNINGIRFRNAVAGNVAQILCTLYGPADPVFESGTPFTATLSPSGGISSNVIVPAIALASFPPANPSDGQAVLLVLPSSYDPVGGKSIRWLCTYDASLTMWHVAGPELEAEIDTSETTASAAYVNLTTVGPAIIIPRAGDYDIWIGADIGETAAGAVAYMSPGMGAGGAVDADACEAIYNAATTPGPSFEKGPRRKLGLTTGEVVTALYRVTGGTGAYQKRRLAVRPLRIA